MGMYAALNAMAERKASSCLTMARPQSYPTLGHLWASVDHESAKSKPLVRCAYLGEDAAHRPKAPSTCTQAPAPWARSQISAAGSKAPVFTFPACRHRIVLLSSVGSRSARILPCSSVGTRY